MTGGTILQIFLFLQIIIMVVLAAFAARYAYAHFKSAQHEPEIPKQPSAELQLSPAAKEHLLHLSQSRYETILNHSAEQLQKDLGITTGHINNLVMRLASEIVSGELERYQLGLSELHKQTEVSMGGIRGEVSKHQAEIEAKIAQELQAEKQHLIKQIDTKLGDAVGSFLLEALGHNVDLGSQSAYLVQMLQEHKADFIKEVDDEKNQPAG